LFIKTFEINTSIISIIRFNRPLSARVPQNWIVKLLALAFFKIEEKEAFLLFLDIAGDVTKLKNSTFVSNKDFKSSKSLTIL
jgi:hypothetical protein